MANYIQKLLSWIGHSVNDVVPAASNVLGHRRLDTDTGRERYYDGSWKDFNTSFLPVTTLTTNTTLTDLYTIVFGDATTAAFTITLPTAVGRTGKRYRIRKVDTSSNFVIIDPDGAETIDGLDIWELRVSDGFVDIVSDGTNWKTIDFTPFDIHGYRKLGTTLNRWYVAGKIANTALANTNITANVLYANPFIVSRTMSINDIGINVITAIANPSDKFKLGIYKDNGNLVPSTLMFDSGELTAVTGTFVSVNISPAKKLQPGVYWLAIITNGNHTVKFIPQAGQLTLLGIDNLAATSYSTPALFKGLVYPAGALPDPYPAAPSNNAAAQIPAVYARFV